MRIVMAIRTHERRIGPLASIQAKRSTIPHIKDDLHNDGINVALTNAHKKRAQSLKSQKTKECKGNGGGRVRKK